ncbi:hypothetical protein PHJA_001896300 [Phtheirospermum japonicum]|uniref:Uncharacterized protein n=1 Tax=Phtheirospermum japonicum TaxID=374723 RepID=A0A830CGX1_9LAMI|nr:hypothetical protein PHJA_001896300 [Phtheirospermum japonicum]
MTMGLHVAFAGEEIKEKGTLVKNHVKKILGVKKIPITTYDFVVKQGKGKVKPTKNLVEKVLGSSDEVLAEAPKNDAKVSMKRTKKANEPNDEDVIVGEKAKGKAKLLKELLKDMSKGKDVKSTTKAV